MAPKPIHEQVRAAREAAGLTQAQLAEVCGFGHQSVVVRIESGEHAAKSDTLQRIADATGATFTIAPAERRRRGA